MYVRLGFAVAAHLDPEILIVDEVLAVGDAEFQKKCLGKMSGLAGEGRTVLFVSHNMGSIKQLCEQGILLSDGKIHYQGEINECVDKYLNMNLQDASTILAHQTYHHEDFLLNQILVNDQENDFVPFSQKQDSLIITVKGTAKSALPIDLELKIKDILGTPLAFYSYGHLKGVVRQVEPGEFDLTWKVKLPKNMLRGDYLLDIDITNPNKKRWASLPNAVRLSVEGIKTDDGRFIEYRSGAGWLILD
jgi:lipopolysaccharide transport system ATP-binding protein